jgi:acetylornithine deacetylase/succinyl-diaminopimelate desuccinylase-like protein
VVAALVAAALASHSPAPGEQAHRVAASIARAGPRPAASVRERRAQLRLRDRFANAGLTVRVQRFATPRGRSRNVIGAWDGRGTCVRVLMAHADTVPPSPGAEDNASGLGLLAALAPRLRALAPRCDVWLVATGAEERIHTGAPDHLGALALARIVPRRRLRYALSLDEVGRGASFRLRSPAAAPRRRVEGELLGAARRAGVRVDWRRDDGTGNSDHREFELAGLAGVKLGSLDNPCRHAACDTAGRLERRAFARVQRLVERVVRG